MKEKLLMPFLYNFQDNGILKMKIIKSRKEKCLNHLMKVQTKKSKKNTDARWTQKNNANQFGNMSINY